jgi:flagellar motor switch protein FliG
MKQMKSGPGGLDDILELSNAKVKEFIRGVDIDDLTRAMAVVTDEVREKVLVNLPKRAKKRYDELSAQIRKTKKSDLKKYRETVEKELKKLFLR